MTSVEISTYFAQDSYTATFHLSFEELRTLKGFYIIVNDQIVVQTCVKEHMSLQKLFKYITTTLSHKSCHKLPIKTKNARTV